MRVLVHSETLFLCYIKYIHIFYTNICCNNIIQYYYIYKLLKYMKLIENFTIILKEKRVNSNLIVNKTINSLSVNKSYWISWDWDITRWWKSLWIQEELKQKIKFLKKRKEIFKKKVLLKVHIGAITNLNKDWSINKNEIVDIDNPLKHVIDTLSNNVIKDDNQIYWIIVTRKFNEKEHAFLTIWIYEYDEEEFYSKFEWIKDKYSSLFSKRINMNGMKIPSFNNQYQILDNGKSSPTKSQFWKKHKEDFKKVLSTEAKEYKKFLQTQIKDDYEDEPDTSGILFLLKVWFHNHEIRDIDNIFKATIDSFTKIVYKDDKQIDTIIAEKKIAKIDSEYLDITVLSRNDNYYNVK